MEASGPVERWWQKSQSYYRNTGFDVPSSNFAVAWSTVEGLPSAARSRRQLSRVSDPIPSFCYPVVLHSATVVEVMAASELSSSLFRLVALVLGVVVVGCCCYCCHAFDGRRTSHPPKATRTNSTFVPLPLYSLPANWLIRCCEQRSSVETALPLFLVHCSLFLLRTTI